MRIFVIGRKQDGALLLNKTGVSRLGWLRAGATGLVLAGLLVGGSETVESEEGIAEEATLLCKNHYTNKEYTKALGWCRQAAEQGDAEAQANLGWMYLIGDGVARDYAEAVKWYRKAAEQGHAAGQVRLGRMYEDGYGVKKNYTEAVKWFRKGVEQGDASAQYNLAFMYWHGKGIPLNKAEAAKWFRKAADQGHSHAEDILEEHF